MEDGMRNLQEKSIWGLEDRLSKLIRPVTPNPEFVSSLKKRLSHTPELILESGKKKISLLAVTIGLATGALVLWLIRKLSR